MTLSLIWLAVLILSGGLLCIGAVLLARFLDGRSWARSLVALKLQFPRDLELSQVIGWLGSVAASTHAPRFSLLAVVSRRCVPCSCP